MGVGIGEGLEETRLDQAEDYDVPGNAKSKGGNGEDVHDPSSPPPSVCRALSLNPERHGITS